MAGVTFSELGVENENDFSSVITNKWIDWFSSNKPVNIANIEVLSPEKQQKLLDFNKVSPDLMLANTPEVFVNSLLLDIQIKIVREKFDPRKNEYVFSYIGAGYLKDLQSNLVIETYNFDIQHKKYKITEEINLANILANHVYKMAIGSFPQIISSVKN